MHVAQIANRDGHLGGVLAKKIETLIITGLFSTHINRHLKMSFIKTQTSHVILLFSYDVIIEIHADSKNVICILIACSIVEIL